MAHTVLSTFELGDLHVQYLLDEQTGLVGLLLVPLASKAEISREKEWELGSLVDVQAQGEPYPGGFAQGRTLRNGPYSRGFTYGNQEVTLEDERTTVSTTLNNGRGHLLEHNLAWHEGEGVVEIVSTFLNHGEENVTLELLTSFTLGGLTPFLPGDTPDTLALHRMRSAWSAEGRHESSTIEALHLERSRKGHAVSSERFGQVGSKPVRGFFPFVAVEDSRSGVLWGAQLAWAGSWQMEAYRKDDALSLSGGLGDREFGHWFKDIAPGESFTSPTAFVSTVKGDLDRLCHSLTSAQKRYVSDVPVEEADLPLMFNEYCTTWGDPTHEKMMRLTETLRGRGLRYLVMDAGWYCDGEPCWNGTQGDWVPSESRFPQGLKRTADAIREAGMVPGIWFEFEVCGERSTAYEMTGHLLKTGTLSLLPPDASGICATPSSSTTSPIESSTSSSSTASVT